MLLRKRNSSTPSVTSAKSSSLSISAVPGDATTLGASSDRRATAQTGQRGQKREKGRSDRRHTREDSHTAMMERVFKVNCFERVDTERSTGWVSLVCLQNSISTLRVLDVNPDWSLPIAPESCTIGTLGNAFKSCGDRSQNAAVADWSRWTQ